ncbi:MAG: hypothetical protein A2Y88_10935 [Chloroflexi bacterium RBG_13_48_10]|nr:MAG: hypothetical protein A2Y88_10935 [Chloroflexi bacterium RBG_13_48_10]
MEWIEFALAAIVGIIIAIVISKLIAKILKWQGKKYQPDKASTFACEDGHVVRSKGEMIIDNWLTQQGILHEYERIIKMHGHPIKYDWRLPETNTYVEYWGFGGKAYMRRKREKIKLYKEGRLGLISIEDKDLENIYERLPPKFIPFTISLHIQENKGKFCPCCGEALDKRFR